MSSVPPVKIIDAIKPANAGTGEPVLRYDNLHSDTAQYGLTHAERSVEFWDSELDSLDELNAAKQLAGEYFLRTAVQLVDSNVGNHDLWADRFTQASIEMYGQPDPAEAARLMAGQYTQWQGLKGSKDVSQPHLDSLLRSYDPILTERPEAFTPDPNREQQKAAIRQYGVVILGEYSDMFDLVRDAGKTTFSPRALRQLFDDQLCELYFKDPAWGEWRAVMTPGTGLSVDRFERTIRIGEEREPADLQETRGLVAHEALVHGLRSKNGYKVGDRKLATGMMGYLDGEEGLGILAEEAVNGELPPRPQSRYIDIALSLGSMDDAQRTRDEIFQLNFCRELVSQQSKGQFVPAKLPILESRNWAYVDRIDRGGLGTGLGEVRAVCTKDIAYHKGYLQMAAYITRQLATGKTAAQIFAYLSLGKFDPEDPAHVDHVYNVTGQIL